MSHPRTSKKSRLKGAERAFREASLFLGESGGFSLAAAVFGHPVRREYWLRRLTDSLAEVKVQLSHCHLPDTDDTRLVNVISQHLDSVPTQTGFKRAVVVTGMSHQLPDAATSHRPGETAPRFLAEANLDRELIPKRCPYPLLLCVTPTALGQITRYAPDLWHWCGHTFDFTEPALPDKSYPIRGIIELQGTNPGTVYANRDELLRATGLFRTGLDAAIAAYGVNHRETISVRARLANVLHQLGRLGEALSLTEENAKLVEATPGIPEEEVALCLGHHALVLHEANRLVEAESLYRRSLKITERLVESDHPSVATCLNNLANLLLDTNRLSEAEQLMRRSLASAEANLGGSDPIIAIRLNNLAILLQNTNRLDEAEQLMRRAIAIDEASHGFDHPLASLRLNNLAYLLQFTNRFTEAEALVRLALKMDEAHFGQSHPRVARHLNNLAQLLQDTNRRVEAEQMMRRVLAIDEASYGRQHPIFALDLNNLGALLQDTNRFDEAEPLMREQFVIFLKSYHDNGHEHPFFRKSINNYRQNLVKMGFTQQQAERKVREMFTEYDVPFS